MATIDRTRWTQADGHVFEVPTGLRQDTALRLVKPGRRLLDVGCGRGLVGSALGDRFDVVHGVDADRSSLEDAAAHGLVTAAADLDHEPLPYPSESFDAALCLEVVEHVLDPSVLAAEIARVLRPGGRLYFSTPNIRFVQYVRTLVLGGRFPVTSGDPRGWQGGHIHFLTFADVEALLRDAGFVEVERHGLIAGRPARLARFVPKGFALEFLSVGIFVVATRDG